tara:strand:- start:4159 stop:4356 length:198 start_codon:yes stop_codon:yes gene_type:complete
MIQKTKLKKAFKDAGMQTTAGAIDLLTDELNRTVRKWVVLAKDGNVKRLTADLVWIALGSDHRKY